MMEASDAPAVRAIADEQWNADVRARVLRYLETSSDSLAVSGSSATTVERFYREFRAASASGVPSDVYMRDHVLSGVWRQLERDVYRRLEIDNWLLDSASPITMDWFWLFVGDSATGSSMHLDVMCTPAWNLVLEGRKRWRLVPPAHAVERKLLPASFLNIPGVRSSDEVIEFEQGAGEAVFIPSGWMHVVENDGPTVALTGNYVDRASMSAVLHYAERGGQAEIAAQLRGLRDAVLDEG